MLELTEMLRTHSIQKNATTVIIPSVPTELLGPVSPTTVNFNRQFSPQFNLQLAQIRFTNAS